MRRALVSILAALLSLPPTFGSTVVLVKTAGGGGGGTGTNLGLFVTFQNDTTTNPYDLNTGATDADFYCSGCLSGGATGSFTTDWTNGGANPGVAVTSACGMVGTSTQYGMAVEGSATVEEDIRFTITSDTTDFIRVASGSIGYWVKAAAWGTGGLRNNLYIAGSGQTIACYPLSNNYCCEYHETTNSQTIGTCTTGSAFTTGTAMFFEYKWNDSTDTITMKWTTTGGTTTTKTWCPSGCDATIDSANGASSATTFAAQAGWNLFSLGVLGADDPVSVCYDNVMVGTSDAFDATAHRNDTSYP